MTRAMVVTIPKALVPLLLALVLLVVATALLAVSHSRTTQRGGNVAVPVASGSDATPGSTAHARQVYRAALGP